jgi:Protein of unknown function (DUF4012)
LSSVREDTSPAMTTRKHDISSWVQADISKLNARGRKRYFRRKSAIKDYFTTDDTIDEITIRHHLSHDFLLELADQCLMQHEDGTLWGFRALVPGVTVINHCPPSTSKAEEIPEEEVLEPSGESSSAEALDVGTSRPDQSSVDNDEFIEVDEDTAKRHAIKISSAGEAVEIVSPDSLNVDVKDEACVAGEMNTADADGEDVVIEVEAVEPAADEAAEPVTTTVEEEQEEVHFPGSEREEAVAQEDAVRADSAIEAPLVAPTPARPSRQVIVRESLVPAVLPLSRKRGKRIDIKKLAQTRRSIHKRWIRNVQDQRRQKRFHRTVASAVVVALLFVVVLPFGTALAAYSTYNTIRSVALEGVNSLLTVKSLFPISKSNPLAALDTAKLQQARSEFRKAESDFMQLQQLVNRPDIQSALEQFAPQYTNQLGMAQHLVQVGIDVSRIGDEVIGVALLGASILHSSPLASGSTKPLITATDVSNAEGVMVHTLYYINDIRAQMSQVSIKDLPVSDVQKKELASLLALLPKAQGMIVQGQGLIEIVSWLLGVGHPRRFLVQTMDRAELRPSGGFTGQYAILQIQDGRMAPFSLQDVTEIDYAGNGMELGRQAPPEYRSWMKYGFWGLRDANLSGDYPTSARLGMQVFQEEGGGPVDGDISFTPTFISHILDVAGPIKVPQYNETITSRNLEDKLHYYQQNPVAIALQRERSGTNNAATRKTFTNILGKLLLDKVRHLQVKQLLTVMQNAIKDIQSRDLEIYFTNPLAESWLVQHGYSGAMDTFTKQDGFMVVQANISISKASQYVHTTEQDNIVLDAQGGATHTLTITLDYNQTGPVYGYNTYADYIRVYAPSNAQFLGGDGFDTGQCLSGSRTGTNPCAGYKSYFPDNGRYCPDGNYSLGQSGYVFYNSFNNWPVDSLGPPTALTSDLPGRAMWGGLTLTPKNCISTITLQWYVPHEVKHIAGQSPYSILLQKQGGYIPTVQITIDTSAIKGLKPFSFEGNLIADRIFSLPVSKK